MISFLQDHNNLRSLELGDDGMAIRIGNASGDLEDVSVIQTSIEIPGRQGGSIALVGPTRMDYDKVVSALEYVANALREYFNKEESGEDSVRRENQEEDN